MDKVLHSTAFWLKNKQLLFVWISAINILTFRSELCIICGLMLLISLFKKRISIKQLIVNGIFATLFSISISVAIDSVFWRYTLWPEGSVLWFNTVLNKSNEWGTSPFFWYFYSAIPRAMLFTLFLIPFGLLYDRTKTLTLFLLPSLGFVLIYSILPHKELRFIIYVFPILNAVAAKGLDDL
jgi:alpha-1,6-mannosyltransferase